jgi:cell wall-associated NlpC family hydrolase
MRIQSTKQRLVALAVTLVAAALATLAATGLALGTPAQIREKRAEAQRVQEEIHQLDIRLEQAVEAYNGATVRLGQLDAAIRQNQRRLAIAKASYRRAQRNLDQRLVTLYTEGEQSTLEVILGSTSLDDLLERLDTADRISHQDAQIVGEVLKARAEMSRRERELERDRAAQRKVVAERKAQKESVQSQLAERQRLAASIKDELARLQAEEAARQRRLREEALRRQQATQASSTVIDVPSGVSSPDGMGSAPPSSYGNSVVRAALSQLGVPYVWGGASPSGFDCSGLVVWAYAQAGRPGLPHYTGALWAMGVPVSYSQLAPGDLVFFYGGSHMGIYIGGGQFVHAPHTGDVVKISDMSPGSYYASVFLGARRI